VKKHIASYILFSEYQCSHCRKLPPDFYDNLGQRKSTVPYLYAEFFDIFKEIRRKWKRPIKITSGYRCVKHQRDLYDQDISSAIISVHNFGLALDLDCSSEYYVEKMVKLIKETCPELRVGWKAYLNRGQSFVHIDCGHLIKPPYSKKLYAGAEW